MFCVDENGGLCRLGGKYAQARACGSGLMN